MIADKFEIMGIENYWQMTFILLGGIVILCNIGLLFIPEWVQKNGKRRRLLHRPTSSKNWWRQFVIASYQLVASTVLMPLLSFFLEKWT